MATLAQTIQIAQDAKNIQHVQKSAQAHSGAPQNVRHLHIAPAASNKAKAQAPAQVSSNIGLIELDVALTRLAICNANCVDRGNSAYNPVKRELETSHDSEIVFFRWGQSHNKRSFALNADGSAQYMVKMGETIITIVECLLRETHRMFPTYEPSYREIRAEVKALRLANLDARDLDLLQTGQWVRIPAIVVCEALTGQGKLSYRACAVDSDSLA